MQKSIPRYLDINAYLEAAGCDNRTKIEECLILRFSELTVTTVKEMHACQKEFYQINFITHSGDGIYRFNEETKLQDSHTLFFISPQHVYSWIRDEKMQGFLLYFHQSFLQLDRKNGEVIFPELFGLTRKNALFLLPKKLDFIAPLFNLMHHAYYAFDKVDVNLLQSTLLSLLFYLKNIQANDQINSTNRQFQYFSSYQNLVNNLFLKEKSVHYYAQRLYLSPNYLNTICKIQSGKSAKFIIQERLLKEAIYLVKTTNKDFAEIAFFLGFRLPTHFSRFFKKHTGQSPKSYRSTAKN